MRFKEFYLLKEEEEIFTITFDKFYEKGYFGDIDKEEVRVLHKEWYENFLKIINERDESELVHTLSNVENKLTREWFSVITGYNIKYKTKHKALLLIKEFIYGK